MCGIFGFAGFENPTLLARMGKVLAHRGPDGEGYFHCGPVSMGMRRLSIIDLAGGDQPIYNEDGTIAVCYNGEIYNYLELMDDLQRRGHTFRTRCDTEVLVHGYEEYGIEVLERLNGMFAFALYDRRREELLLARDRAGQKPLYYYHRNGQFLFASEIKAILEADQVERRCHVPALDSYLALRYVPQPETLFEGISVLPAAHYMRLKNGHATTHRYWRINLSAGAYRKDSDYADEFKHLFFDAVRVAMRSDVPVAAYLSGGVDSSMIVAAMRGFTDRLKTFSLGFGSAIDETAQAEELARRLGCEHQTVRCGPEQLARLPDALWHLERPIGDALILAYFRLAEAASQHGKVVLSGEGADELFGGYSFHKIIQWTERYHRWVPRAVNRNIAVPLLNAAPVDLLDRFFVYPAHLGARGKAKTVEYLRRYADRTLRQNYVALRALFDESERRLLYAGPLKEQASDDWQLSPASPAGPFLDRLLALQFDDWLQDNLLLRQDKNTMAHSLELRAPFLDHRLIELAFRMPPHLKIRGLVDKYVERELARELLPPQSVRRSKNPFYFPLEDFRTRPELEDLVRMTLDPERVRRRGYFDPASVSRLVSLMDTGEFLYLKQVLSLVILELWHMVFIDNQRMS
jgi:asparagine synthase (glutamine-hydrolysing)